MIPSVATYSDEAYRLDEPLSMDEARKASRAAAENRRNAETNLEAAIREAADKERTYRRELSIAIVKAEGTAAAREITARSDAADAAYDRDVAAGMVKVAEQRLRGLEGERAMLRQLIEWSKEEHMKVLLQGVPVDSSQREAA